MRATDGRTWRRTARSRACQRITFSKFKTGARNVVAFYAVDDIGVEVLKVLWHGVLALAEDAHIMSIGCSGWVQVYISRMEKRTCFNDCLARECEHLIPTGHKLKCAF